VKLTSEGNWEQFCSVPFRISERTKSSLVHCSLGIFVETDISGPVELGITERDYKEL
jgi:hypothetical protein